MQRNSRSGRRRRAAALTGAPAVATVLVGRGSDESGRPVRSFLRLPTFNRSKRVHPTARRREFDVIDGN